MEYRATALATTRGRAGSPAPDGAAQIFGEIIFGEIFLPHPGLAQVLFQAIRLGNFAARAVETSHH
jgi:hypothetical protein